MNGKITKSLLFALIISILTVLTVFSASAKTVTKNKLVYEISAKTATVVECKSNAKKIKIPSKIGKYKVTAIGEKAFSGKKKLQSVELPESLTKIGKSAFEKCNSLKEIVIPSKVVRILDGAFRDCKNLKKAVIPKSVTKFGSEIFEDCNKLTAYVVKGSKAEKYIKKLDNVTLAYRYMTSLRLDADGTVLYEGETLSLNVIKKPKKLYNSKVSFSSDNPSVATVSSKGVITARSEGTAVITCKSKDGSGKKAVCTVYVKTKEARKQISLTPTAPSAVSGIKATSVSESSVSISWDKVTGATGYKIYLYDEAANVYTYKWATSALQAEIKGLEPAKEYSFAVKAYTRNYYSSADSASYSKAVTAKTLPGSVSEIIADKKLVYPDKLTLSWNEVAGADGYNLYIYSKTEKDYVLYKATADLMAEISGLRPGTDYRFRIRTYSGEDKTEGAFSKTFTFTTDRLPATAQQAAEGFLEALSATKKLDSSFTVYTVFSTEAFYGENEKTESVIDSLDFRKTNTFIFENGIAEKDGLNITADDVIHPYGKESSLTWSDIDRESVGYYQSGYGYSVSFDVLSEEAKDIAFLTDTEKLKEENPEIVLYSYETGKASVISKVTDEKLDYLLVKVPVIIEFILDGEMQKIEYTVSQRYMFSY